MIYHQSLRRLIELNNFTSKLTWWVLLLQEYDIEIVHHVSVTNLDANGVSRNPSPMDNDMNGARWHGNCD